MFPGSSTSPTALFHGCEDYLKLLECVVGITREIVLEVWCLQNTGKLSFRQKGTGEPQLIRWQINFLLPQAADFPKNCSYMFGRKRTVRSETYYVWEWYWLTFGKYPTKGPISDMQCHGMSRHHDQWPHAPTCVCDWDYNRPMIHWWSFTSSYSPFPWCSRW